MLDQVKTLLGLSDESQDEKLKSVITLTSARLASLLGVKDVPEEMQYIAIEASIRRFNRIGSEGMSSHNVEGESVSYRDNDFADFMDDIQAWKTAHETPVRRLRFL